MARWFVVLTVLMGSVSIAQQGPAPQPCDAAHGCRLMSDDEFGRATAFIARLETATELGLEAGQTSNEPAHASQDASRSSQLSDRRCFNFAGACFPVIFKRWVFPHQPKGSSPDDLVVTSAAVSSTLDICAIGLGMKVLFSGRQAVELIGTDATGKSTYLLAIGDVQCSELPSTEQQARAGFSRVAAVSRTGLPGDMVPPRAVLVTATGSLEGVEKVRKNINAGRILSAINEAVGVSKQSREVASSAPAKNQSNENLTFPVNYNGYGNCLLGSYSYNGTCYTIGTTPVFKNSFDLDVDRYGGGHHSYEFNR